MSKVFKLQTEYKTPFGEFQKVQRITKSNYKEIYKQIKIELGV